MFKKPFSFKGRIRRTEYGISLIIYVIARIIIGLVALGINSNPDEADLIATLMSLPLLIFLWAQGAKRCHDINNSGWMQLIPFYVLVMIFKDEVNAANKYGESPKGTSPKSTNNSLDAEMI